MINGLFFELVRVAIGTQDRLSRIPSEREWGMLYQLAKKQSLLGICFAAIERLRGDDRIINKPSLDREDLGGSSIPHPLYLRWMGIAAKIQQRNEVVNGYTAKALEYFRANGFPSYILKGQGIAKLYGDLAAYRQSGDIDVWVNGSRKELYQLSNGELGKITGLTYHHIHYPIFEDCEVEAHIWPSFLTNPIQNRLFQTFCKRYAPVVASKEDVPSLAFNRVFILQHCYGHFCGHGVGMRQVLDYYYVLKQGFTAEERNETMSWIDQLGLKRFAAALIWVCVEVFGMDGNLCICEPNEEDGRFLLDEIMLSGNMGHRDARINHEELHSAFGRYVHNIKRDWQIMRIAPSYALWEPLWGIYQFAWCKLTQMKYKNNKR